MVTGFLLTVAAMRWQASRKISRVVVSGTTLIPAHEIVELVRLPEDSLTINEMSFGLIERRVQRHPFVKTVSAFRSSGDAIMLKIQERKPVAHVLYKNKQYYIDDEATLLPYRLVGSIVDVPMIAFVGRSSMDSTTLRQALTVVQTLETQDKELARNISELEVRPNGEFVLIMASGATPVLFGTAEDVGEKIDRLGIFWRIASAQMTQKAFSYIDVRWSNRIITRPAL